MQRLAIPAVMLTGALEASVFAHHSHFYDEVSGARIAVTGYRIRTAAELKKIAPKFKGDVNPNTVEARSLRRVDDSFVWAPKPSAYPPNCSAP